jgi:hypothetical protein
MSQHTPEMWTYGKAENVGFYLERVNSDQRIGYTLKYADASRIVACVNACASFSTEDLEQCPLVSPNGFDLYRSVAAQRDELLAALKQLVNPLSHKQKAFDAAHATIAKAEAQS